MTRRIDTRATSYAFIGTDTLVKREQFAALAMQGLLANPDYDLHPKDLSDTAVEYADLLITALNRRGS